MCNFNKQSEETKARMHLLIQECAQKAGGVNFLLGLVEAIKAKKPNALIDSSCKVESKELRLSWNKIIFKDKFDVLEELLRMRDDSEGITRNILDVGGEKKRKKTLTMLKTLTPVEFKVVAKDTQKAEGFELKIFETLQEGTTTINPLFAILFFCSAEFTKKALKYEAA